MVKRIYMVRHGQGEHNVKMDPNIPDPLLTDLGREQARELNAKTANTIQKTTQLLLRRCLETTVVGFPTLVDRLTQTPAETIGLDTLQCGDGLEEEKVHVDIRERQQGQESKAKAIVLDILQESGGDPSSTPTFPVDVLKHSQGDIYSELNYDHLSSNYASKSGIFAPTSRRVAERAKSVRKWLRAREEDEIVVVSHGGIMHSIVDQGDQETEWDHCQIRVFTFDTSTSDPDSDDPDMIELVGPEAVGVKVGTSAPALRVDQLPGATGVLVDE